MVQTLPDSLYEGTIYELELERAKQRLLNKIQESLDSFDINSYL